MILKDYFLKADKQKWAIGQFNFSTMGQLRGILAAAKKTKSPVILGTSEGESKFFGLREVIALVEISKMKYGVPAFLNLDHGKDFEWIKKCIDFGYPAVHFDGSTLPIKENIKKTKEVVSYAHRKGVLVEAELGLLKGESIPQDKEIKINEKDLTSPEEAKEFIKKTGIDSLAPVVGNVHGVYKKMPKLQLDLLKRINEQSNAFLVLHGGSGIPDSDIKNAIKLGIRKINFNTELRISWKESLKAALETKEFKPYKILPYAEAAVQKKVEEKIKILGSRNKI